MEGELETCAHFSCEVEVPEGKLFCEKHWNALTRKEQMIVFEAWSYGMDYVDEEDYDCSWD